jgi:protein-disulfide isomerase
MLIKITKCFRRACPAPIKVRWRLPNKKDALALAVVLACISAIYIARFYLRPGEQGSLNPRGGHRSLGNLQYPVKIIAFSDFQCPSCREGAIVLREYMHRYPGQIYLEQRYFPAGIIHRHAYLSAYFAQCAAEQNRFWELYALLFDRQKIWDKMSREEAREVFLRMASSLKMDSVRLQSCVDSSRTRAAILEDKVTGENLGIRATPTYFINGSRVVGPGSLKKEMEKILGEKKN